MPVFVLGTGEPYRRFTVYVVDAQSVFGRAFPRGHPANPHWKYWPEIVVSGRFAIDWPVSTC